MTVNSDTRPRITALGTTAMLLELPGELALPTQQKIWGLARTVDRWPQIAEAVPGMNNLSVDLVWASGHLRAVAETGRDGCNVHGKTPSRCSCRAG